MDWVCTFGPQTMYMHRLIIFCGLLFMLSSSQSNLSSGELLPRDQMVAILVDLELAKSIADHYADNEDTARWLFQKNVLLIYQTHETDLDTFQRSYQYYLTHLETMEELYALVTKQIEALSEQL